MITKAILAVAIAAPLALQVPRSLAAAQPAAGGCSLTVHVSGFRNHKGLVGGALYSSPDGWPENEDKAVTHTSHPISADKEVLNFEHLPPGRYGIVVLHDENSNHRLDRNFLRVPKEGFGFANNPHVALSAPAWKDASVEVSCPSTQVDIQLIYK